MTIQSQINQFNDLSIYHNQSLNTHKPPNNLLHLHFGLFAERLKTERYLTLIICNCMSYWIVNSFNCYKFHAFNALAMTWAMLRSSINCPIIILIIIIPTQATISPQVSQPDYEWITHATNQLLKIKWSIVPTLKQTTQLTTIW